MGFKTIFIASLVFLSFMGGDSKMYSKVYHENGTLKAEGWVKNNQKVNYWKFYHPNGKVASQGHYDDNEPDSYWYYYNNDGDVIKEGHYEEGSIEDWWIFYDIAQREMRKTQFMSGKKNGYSLIYLNKKLKRVEKYENDKHIGEWTSVSGFYRDNPDVSIKR